MFRFFLSVTLAFALNLAFAEPITLKCLNDLPSVERLAWKTYLERSQANSFADVAAVQAEVAANKMTNALRAPSGGDFKLSFKTG